MPPHQKALKICYAPFEKRGNLPLAPLLRMEGEELGLPLHKKLPSLSWRAGELPACLLVACLAACSALPLPQPALALPACCCIACPLWTGPWIAMPLPALATWLLCACPGLTLCLPHCLPAPIALAPACLLHLVLACLFPSCSTCHLGLPDDTIVLSFLF